MSYYKCVGSSETKNQCFGVETWKYNLSTQKNYLSIADAGITISGYKPPKLKILI